MLYNAKLVLEARACAMRAFYFSTFRSDTRLLSCQSTYYRAQKVQTTLLTIASLGIFLRVASCAASPRFYRRPGFYQGDLTVKMEPNRAHQADLSMCFAVMGKQKCCKCFAYNSMNRGLALAYMPGTTRPCTILHDLHTGSFSSGHFT